MPRFGAEEDRIGAHVVWVTVVGPFRLENDLGNTRQIFHQAGASPADLERGLFL